jgi:ABC-type lipoprotein release transport system permease subunit
MRRQNLLANNLRYYWRTNLAVVAGVGVGVAVLAGALLVGASVRGSLRDILLERLGKTEYVIAGQNFFRAQLAADISANQSFTACPIVALTGVVEHETSQRRAAGVQVYGVDERFWQFHGQDFAAPQGREILLSASLARELQPQTGETILLRVEKPSAIPVESLHGRKDDLGESLRLDFRSVAPPAAMGDFSLRPTQAGVRAVFVSLALLQQDLEQPARVNTLLIAANTSGSPTVKEGVGLATQLNAVIKEKATLEDLGVNLRPLADSGFAVQSESGLLNDYLAEQVSSVAAQTGAGSQPTFAYLANAIRLDDKREIPYSLVMGIDDGFDWEKSEPPPIALSEWAARDANAKAGDSVTLEYYLWQEDGGLATKTERFVLSKIVARTNDRDLVPTYPGITEATNVADWNPPFPVDLKKIRPQDETFWKQFRTTPKAFISPGIAEQLWGSRFGKTTAIKITRAAPETFAAQLKANLEPSALGLTLLPVKADGLQSARGTTDFGEYFLYFSFFLVVSALLLAALFFRFGIEQRAREIGLLQAVGFSRRAIRGLFLREGLALAVVGGLLGVAGAIVYAKLIILGLNNWWSGAVGTNDLRLHVAPAWLAAGCLAGVAAALAGVALTLRGLARQSARGLLHGSLAEVETPLLTRGLLPARGGSPRMSKGVLAVLVGVLGLLMLAAATFKFIGQAAGFFGGGTLLLVAALCGVAAWLRRPARRPLAGLAGLGLRYATQRPGRSVLCVTLIAAAAFIVVTVDAFRKDDRSLTFDRASGNGGYTLLAESQLPLLYNPNTPAGRAELNLADAPNVAVTRFRVRPGDDASCLNLFQAQNPRVIAPADDFLNANRFTFGKTLTPSSNPWKLLEQPQTDGALPVIADANSLTYALHLNVGDVFALPRGGAEPLRLRIIGALSDSIFQGELLMSEENFLRAFPEQQGFRFFLLDAPPEISSNIAATFEEKLSDFGFDARPANERLAEFHRVENTYLATFQMLGALGLALGTLGLGAILLRNVLERRRELALLRAVGYGPQHFALMALAENGFLLLCGLFIGTACALVAIVPVALARGGGVPWLSVGGLLALVAACGLGASWLATKFTLRAPLLQELRAE